jgi:predicted glutamine amidotransferase
MCRLFGMSAGSERARATFWLLGAPDSLAIQSHREPDGTGLGWFDSDGAPHVSKQPIAAYDDAEFGRQAREVCSNTFLAHVRFATTGPHNLLNTHPFEQDGRLFAHNGVVEDLPALEAHLGGDSRLVKGETDSERFFALITREIAARDGDVNAGIEAACTWVAANLRLVSINFVLATANGLWALRYPETDTLYLLERAPREPLEHASSLGSRVHSQEGVNRPLVVVASEPMDADPLWRPLASGELICVTDTLEVRTRQILDHPPARPLALDEADPGAHASQEPAANMPDGERGRDSS